MRVALFGGSFDPPHIGHLKIIEEVIKSLDIDKLIVMPTFLNPFKKEFFAPPNMRLKWLKEIVSEFENVQICDYEIEQNRPVATIESVEYLNSIGLSVKYVIIGADNLSSLDKWRDFKKLNALVEFVVVTREGIFIDDKFKKIKIDIPISSTNIREELKEKLIPKKILNEVILYYKENYE